MQPSRTLNSPWRSTPFRWLLIGRTLTSLGSAIAPVAMALAVLRLGGSATDLGLVVAAYAVVDVTTTLFGGVLGDRFSRAPLMRGTAVLTCLAQLVLALGLLTGMANVPMLAVLSAVNGALSAIAEPSSRAVVPQTVAAACFGAMRIAATAAPEAHSLLNDLGAGERSPPPYVAVGAPRLRAGLSPGLRGVQGVLGPVLVTREFGDAAWGLAMTALMIGFMVGVVVTLRYRPDRLLLAGTGFVVLTACFPLAMALHLPLAIILLGAFAHGLGLEIFSVNWDLAIQQNVAPDKLTRVFAFDQVGSFVMRPLGLALTGPVAAAVGERSWLVIVAAVMTAANLLALLPPPCEKPRRPI